MSFPDTATLISTSGPTGTAAAGTTTMFLPTAGSAAAAQAAAVASVTQQQLQLQTAAQHINNINNVAGTGQTQVSRQTRIN